MSFGDQLKKRREELGLRPRFVVDGAFLSQLVGRQRVVVVPVALDVVLRVADVAVFEDAFFLNIGETLLFSGRRGVGSLDADPPLQRIDLRQAAAAERLVDRDPAAAKEAIAEVRRTAKGALEEIRAMIGVLRAEEGPAETTPTQGTDRMGDLVSYLEGADIEVTLDETAYDRACVPAFIDVALFGIAREAATNIVRHAGARRATLALSTKREGFAELIVDDDGRGLAAPAAAAGHHGLLGMRERARLLQGTFSAFPSPLGGVRIAVSVPLSQKEETHA